MKIFDNWLWPQVILDTKGNDMKTANTVKQSKLLFAVFFAVITLSVSLASKPASAAIQMLPPIDGNGSVCGSLGMLQWDGANAITCIPGFYGDVVTGNVTQTAPAHFFGGMHIESTQATLGNDKSTVIWEELAEQCNGAGNVGVDKSGYLHCCPLGKIVTSSDDYSVTCGTLN